MTLEVARTTNMIKTKAADDAITRRVCREAPRVPDRRQSPQMAHDQGAAKAFGPEPKLRKQRVPNASTALPAH